MNPVVADLHAAAKAAYWHEKDLPKCLVLAQQALELAVRSGARDQEKAISYDIASFCWPGWDEPGISIRPEDLVLGKNAADRNLILAIELNRPAAPMANAHFMVGAHHLAAGRYEEAIASFAEFRRFADQTDDPAQVLLADGYLALARPTAGESEAELANILNKLDRCGYENGPFFRDQLITASKVFGKATL